MEMVDEFAIVITEGEEDEGAENTVYDEVDL